VENLVMDLPSFMELKDDEIYINLDLVVSRNELIRSFDYLFNKYYFENIEYESFSNLIYDFDKIKKESSERKIKFS